jgi:hypothetical protein
MLGANRLVFNSEDIDYSQLSHIILSENSENVGPDAKEGEQKILFLGTAQVKDWTDISVLFHSVAVLISGSDVGIHCSAPNRTHVARGKQLTSHLTKMRSSARVTFVEHVASADSGESDSGDEAVTVDRELPRVFSDSDIVVVQLPSDNVWKFFEHATVGSYSNGPRKCYMDSLAKFHSSVAFHSAYFKGT